MSKPSVTVMDKGWEKLYAEMMGDPLIGAEVGVFEGTHSSGVDMVELATWLELGTSQMPGRRPIASSLEELLPQLRPELASFAKAIFSGTITREKVATSLGKWASNRIKQRIRSVKLPPPLAESTVKRKGHDHPLIDTEQYVEAITFRVK